MCNDEVFKLHPIKYNEQQIQGLGAADGNYQD